MTQRTFASRLARAALLLASLAQVPAEAVDGPIGVPRSVAVGSAHPGPGDRTIPTFTNLFGFDGVTYPYTMVGTDPHTSAGTAMVPTEILPLRIVFADGNVFDGTPRVAAVIVSPIFQPANFISGYTQFGDAIQRAEFWTSVSANGGGYHVLLGQPTVLPTVTINVPAGRGLTGSANGIAYGLIDFQWFFFNVTQRLLGQLHLDPATLPISLSDAVYLTFDHGDGCCVGGFHGTISYGDGPASGKGNQKINTFAWASWSHTEHFGNADNLGGRPLGGDIDFLTHEISEWYNDPFVTNLVPTWDSPISHAFYGCSSLLESGDPLVGVEFEVNGYHLQDQAFKSWFAHDRPSEGINEQYTYLGTFTEPSTLCE